MTRLHEYEYAGFGEIVLDLGLFFNELLSEQLAESFAEYLQLLAYEDQPYSALNEIPDQTFTLPVDSDSESSFVIDEFDKTTDVQNAIAYYYDHIHESIQASSFLSAILFHAARFSAIQQVWWAKCARSYGKKYSINEAAENVELDEIQNLGLFINNYESQFGTPLRVDAESIPYLRCVAGCTIETRQGTVRRGFSFPPVWDAIVRK